MFRNWLQSEIDKREWSKADLAERAGVARSSITMIFQEARLPGMEVCLGLSKALKVSPVTVLQMAGLMPEEPENKYSDDLIHLFNQMDENRQSELLDYMRLQLKLQSSEPKAKQLEDLLSKLPPDELDDAILILNKFLKVQGRKIR